MFLGCDKKQEFEKQITLLPFQNEDACNVYIIFPYLKNICLIYQTQELEKSARDKNRLKILYLCAFGEFYDSIISLNFTSSIKVVETREKKRKKERMDSKISKARVSE